MLPPATAILNWGKLPTLFLTRTKPALGEAEQEDYIKKTEGSSYDALFQVYSSKSFFLL